MRGDRPEYQFLPSEGVMFTPHARGSTYPGKNVLSVSRVYPACAGIDPANGAAHRGMGVFTPHARGSTRIPTLACMKALVYPACAGIDLDDYENGYEIDGLPRMRGDRPWQRRGDKEGY